MENGVRAFFYDYKYYLFPDDITSLKELKNKSEIRAKRLKEEGCMAPDFIYESIEEETVVIDDPKKVFEVYVDLYTREEYDEILGKQVSRVCPGCVYYDDVDDGKLDGHHREISLSGTCYIRNDEKEGYELGDLFDWYWDDVSERLNELAECIDKNNQKKLNKILNENLTKFFFGTEFYGLVYEGKYTLCIVNPWGVPYALMGLHGLMAYAAQTDNSPIKSAGWNVFPYRPAGTYKCGKKVDMQSPSIRLESRDGDESVVPFIISVYHPCAEKMSDKAKSKLLGEVYDGLVSEIGEDAMFRTVCALDFTSDDAGLISLQAACERLKCIYDSIDSPDGDDEEEQGPDVNSKFPPCFEFGARDDISEYALPYRNDIECVISRCSDLSCLTKDVDERERWWTDFASFAYIYVPKQTDDPELPVNVLSWYFSNLNRVPEPIRDPNETRISGVAIGIGDCGNSGYVLDHMIISEKGMFRNLRILAPVLKAYGAKVVVVNKEGTMAYDCDYEFKPVD